MPYDTPYIQKEYNRISAWGTNLSDLDCILKKEFKSIRDYAFWKVFIYKVFDVD